MLLWKTVDIADNMRALLYRRDRFERVLEPGRHRLAGKVRVEIYEITELVFKHTNPKYFMHNHAEKLSAFLDSVELNDTQVGLVYCDRHLTDVLAPGTFYPFWRGVEDVHVEIINIDEAYQIDEKLIGVLGRGRKIGGSKELLQAISYNEIADEHVGLLLVNGKLEQILKPGNYGFWKYNRSVVVKLLDMRLQVAEVNGQEILTKDRVSLRLNLSASYRIRDPEVVALKLNDYAGFIYRELQLRLREAVGTKTLDQLLEDKDSLNVVIAESVLSKFKEYGVDLLGVGVKDIILPGDMKVILNQVVEAQKEAEANLIKRREETQAMRSLHNTAKMMENNPTLMRLKELESLERITERIDKISVYGGLDGVLNDLVKLAPAAHGR